LIAERAEGASRPPVNRFHVSRAEVLKRTLDVLRKRTPVWTLSALIGACFIVAAFANPGAARAAPIVVKHAQGEVTLPDVPKRIIVLDFSSLEVLDAIGVDVVGVVGTLMPEHLAKYRSDTYVKSGTLFEPDYEAISAAKPDLIIVSARSSPKYKELSRIAPTIDLSTDDKDHVGSAIRNAQTLGRIFGKEDAVEALVAKLKASIAALREKTAQGGRGLIILTTGGKMSAYGPTSRFGALHRDFGVPPAVEDLDRAIHGQGISFELILKSNPDWLFVLDRDVAVGRGGQPAAALLDNPLVARTTAWQKGQVVYLDPVRWYLVGGGLASLQACADQIAAAYSAAR
jgi:iron complex transport system substrate-binding protein